MQASGRSATPTTAQAAAGDRRVPPLSEADIAGGIHPRVLALVSAQPDALAVLDARAAWTTTELVGRACAVAERVHGLPDPALPVTVLVDHDAAGAATILGVLLSGRPVLVMDPTVPVPRLRGFVDRLGAQACVAASAHLPIAAQLVAAGSGQVVATPAQAPGPAPSWAASTIWTRPPAPDGIATLGFTSGSTGTPKVVALDHRHLVGDAWAGSTANGCVRPDDVTAHTLPFAFAAGMNALLTGILAGATTALYDTRAHGIAGLADWIEQAGVSVVQASPAILRAFVGTGPAPDRLARVRSLTLGGEAAHGRDVAAARALLPPGCTVSHRLASTETGLIAELRLGPGDPTPEGPLAVGQPIGPTVVRLVGDDGAEVPLGETGTIEVTRSYLATGYWGDLAATEKSFRDNGDGTRTFRSRDLGRWDADGTLWMLGRRDHSVKIRGYLVEPGEVDAALFALPEVREAVTVGRPRPGDGVVQLVAYLVPAVQQLSPAAVRAALRQVLPAYMVPTTIVLMDALPRTERGKIDRSALPEPPHRAVTRPEAEELSDWERLVGQVFAQALAVEDVGPDDDFFELGGDSLAAEALVTTMVQALGVDPGDATIALLVEAPTARRFAARLARTSARQDVLVPVQPTGERPPLFVVAGGGGLGVAFVWLARRLGADQPVWALQAHGLERRAFPDRSVAGIARRNLAALRTVQPEGPYLLAGHSFGGTVAYEMAHQLRAAGEQVRHLLLLDVFPPDPALLPPEESLPWPARLKQPLGLALTGLRRQAPSEVSWHFYRFSGRLQRRYRGRPWSGDTTVVVAEDGEDREQRSRWGPFLTGSWTTATVGGDHLSMLREPYVDGLAAAVREALSRAGVPSQG